VSAITAKWLIPLMAGLLSSAVTAEEVVDWRLELLKENGLPAETEALKKFLDGLRQPETTLDQSLRQLGSEEYTQREQAQQSILRVGRKALPKLRPLLRSDDPEVRTRIAAIIDELEAGVQWEKSDLLRQAAASLLRERENPGAPPREGLLFVELFSKQSDSLADGYKGLKFESGVGVDGSVREGIARLKGKRADDGDQRLLLLAKDLTGKAEFPDSFRIQTRIGGGEEGMGVYHVGVSIGNVRALFHPGYSGGAFRFEQVSNNMPVVPTTDMGFDPPAGELLPMRVDVKRQANRDVEIRVMITRGKDTFRKTHTVKAAIIGKLDRIGLDRSGRSGGDALFDDFVVGVE
jgi:hypothetical protein